MSMYFVLAYGLDNGRVHHDQDPSLLRDVELAQKASRRDRRARRLAARRA